METFYEFQVGRFRCLALLDGSGSMPIERMFPTVPQEKLLAVMAAHNLTTPVATSMNLLAIQTGEQWVLVDSGLGNGRLAQSMQAAGIQPADINTLVITHGDGDHINGLGQFPQATIVMPRLAWELWTNETSCAQMVDEWIQALGADLPEDSRAQRAADRDRYGHETLPALQERLMLVEAEMAFLPGFKFVPAPGHRSDQFAVEIGSEGDSLLHVADAFRHPVQAIQPTWATLFDTYPEQTAATAVSLYQRASANNSVLFCAHFAFPGLVRVRQTANAWDWHALSST